MKQANLINLLKRQFVSPLDALNHLGIYRFSARIHDIKRIYGADRVTIDGKQYFWQDYTDEFQVKRFHLRPLYRSKNNGI